MVGERLERAASKALLASELALTGAVVGGPVGAVIGGIAGLIVGDSTIIFPVPMIAIPAHEYSAMLDGRPPSVQIYINAGEVLTQIQPTEAQETLLLVENKKPRKKRKRKLTGWNKFMSAYIKGYHKKHPKGKKTNGTLMKEAAKKWKSHKRGKK